LSSGTVSENFTPNRILTTFLGLEAAILFSKILGSINGWLVMNILFYFASCILFFNLLLKIYDSQKTALIGTLFLASNYAMLRFGLNFLMDLGGWMFYLTSLFFVWSYLENNKRKDILFASVMVGVGGLFKEYAFLGFLPIIGILLYENYRQFFVFLKKSVVPVLIMFVPTTILHLFVYFKFNYTYLDWLNSNQEHYIYSSRALEYIKSFGSLLNVLGILFIFGIYFIWRERKTFNQNIKIFVTLVGISILPIFFWPAITQRILFITTPFVILISAFLIKKYQKYWFAFIPVLILYLLASFFMDSYILPNFNLPI
ncbi:MAG: glycosyltransferase family 39 protein, partial [Patescibacteria group bacterium]